MRKTGTLAAVVLLAACKHGHGGSAHHDGAAPRASIPEVAAMLAEVDPARLKADVDRLVAFGTRHTLSDTTSDTRGVGAARRWIESEMRKAGGGAVQVTAESHLVHPDGKRVNRDVDVVDVVGVLTGTSPEARARRYYVLGHYDSRCTDPMNTTCDAPGANDDASGVALVLELTRVLAKRKLGATVVFLATAGEEQGLLGAKEHAATLKDVDVRGVLNNDIVGDPAGGDRHVVRVFSKGDDDSPARALARFAFETGEQEHLDVMPEIILRPDRTLRGGDHLAFADAGFAAVRFTASAEDYTRQHQDVRTENGVAYGDTPAHVDAAYLAGVARANAATLMHLANAPEPPPDTRVVAELSNDTLLRWSPSRDADVAGYEVVWRATTSATWEHVRDVGRATEARLPLSKDDFFFGVRAYDAQGYRSPVAFAHPVAP
ncbi:MAG TPA: M28 family metallopeptidase [Polyangiaceae bacterium]